MRRQLRAVLILLVALPLGLLGWLGLRVARSEQELISRRLEQLQVARLRDIDERVQRLLEQRARTLMELTEKLPYHEPETLRRLVRQRPEVEQLLVDSEQGQLLFPPLSTGLSTGERAFLMRVRTIVTERLLWHLKGSELQGAASSQQQVIRRQKVPQEQLQGQQSLRRADHGWYAWYWERGLHLLFWRHDGRGNLVAVELSRMRLLADIINELPTTAEVNGKGSHSGGVVALVDAQRRVLYRWGDGEVPENTEPAVQLALSAPLGAWQLHTFQRAQDLVGGGLSLLIGVAAFLAMAGMLIGLSVYLYRESTREWREARQRVQFVNQVSHELRTPLTNIRLYAELLEQRLVDADERSRSHLRVIVSESRRLSRLIGNVLTFARHRRGRLRLHRTTGVIDTTLTEVVDQFRPSLAARGVTVELGLDAPQPFPFDTDAVEQVLANLLNNVEKYAADGGLVSIGTSQDQGCCRISVADQGPGIPAGKQQAIFEPFVRLGSQLNEGVSGTGMGLSISREIARLHGGELQLQASQQGACFVLTLPMGSTVETESEMQPGNEVST